MTNDNYFTKDYSNFYRIPESRLLRSHAAWDVYLFLQDMVYRKETGFYGNNNHYESGIMAREYKAGKIGTFTTVLEIEKYRGLSKNTVKTALKILVKLGLVIIPEDANREQPWDTKGMFYQIGKRIKKDNNRYEGDETFLEIASRKLDIPENAKGMQLWLIEIFSPKATPLPIYNLRFEGVKSSDVKKTPKTKKPKKETVLVEDSPFDFEDKDILDEVIDVVYEAVDNGYLGVEKINVMGRAITLCKKYTEQEVYSGLEFFRDNWKSYNTYSMEEIIISGIAEDNAAD